MLLISAVGYVFVQRLFDGIEKVPDPFPSRRPATGIGRAENFLLVGSDTREGATPAELAEAATTYEPGRRSDTVILIHLSARTDKVLVLSFPRDAYVEIPGRRGRHKLNRAYSEGGPPLTIETIERLTDVRVDHYLEVDFNGFFAMVEALGGVDVCLPTAQQERYSGIDLPAGRSRVKGKQALAFVRQRYGLPRGDIDRIERQQQFIGAMMRRATSKGILLRPGRLLSFADSLQGALRIDDQVEIEDMTRLARRLSGLDPAKVQLMTVPVDGFAEVDGQDVVLLDQPAIRELFDQVRDDRFFSRPAAAPAPTAAPVLTVAAAEIRVDVLNGSGRAGLARRAARDLRRSGFRTGDVANAEHSSYAVTEIHHGIGDHEAARTLAAAFPGARVVADPTLDGSLAVVLGADFTAVRDVPVGAGAPTARPSAPPRTAADNPCAG